MSNEEERFDCNLSLGEPTRPVYVNLDRMLERADQDVVFAAAHYRALLGQLDARRAEAAQIRALFGMGC